VLAVEDAAPFHVERDLGYLGKARGEDLGQRALDIVIVEHLGRQPERGLAAAEVYVDAVARHGHRPEDAVRVDVGIVVVNLVWSNWTVEDVQSDETERRLTVLAVLGDVDAIREAHVRLERERPEAGARSSPANAGVTDEAVEVGDV